MARGDGSSSQAAGSSAEEVFGYPDNLKFRSSMTLFAHASDGEAVFQTALDKYFGGQPDTATLQKL